MSNGKKLGIVSLMVSFGVVCCSFLYDPYSPDRIKNAKLKAQLCDKEAIAYLGDYLEKRGLETEIHDLMQLSQKCTVLGSQGVR
jgi:hypothetical protein